MSGTAWSSLGRQAVSRVRLKLTGSSHASDTVFWNHAHSDYLFSNAINAFSFDCLKVPPTTMNELKKKKKKHMCIFAPLSNRRHTKRFIYFSGENCSGTGTSIMQLDSSSCMTSTLVSFSSASFFSSETIPGIRTRSVIHCRRKIKRKTIFFSQSSQENLLNSDNLWARYVSSFNTIASISRSTSNNCCRYCWFLLFCARICSSVSHTSL